MDLGLGAYLLQAALVFGAPDSPGTYEKGLFCETVELVERVAELADRRANPVRVVADINARLGHTACIYATKPEVRARTVRFEKTIAANHTDYAIYQVQVTAHGIAEDRDRRYRVDVLAAADDVHAARRGAGADRQSLAVSRR